MFCMVSRSGIGTATCSHPFCGVRCMPSSAAVPVPGVSYSANTTSVSPW